MQTLKESAQQAILSNPEVLARWHAFEAAKSERSAAAGSYLPRVDLAAGAGREFLRDSQQSRSFNRGNVSLTLTQMLYDGFATKNDVSRLDHASLVRLYELHDTSENVALDVARAYFDVLRYRKLVTLAEDNYVQHRSVFEQIQRKAQAGVGRRVDMEQAAGRLALAESNMLTETSNLHDVSARFQRLVGSIPRKELEDSIVLSKAVPTDMTVAMQAASKRHPALLAAIENVRSADAAAQMRNANNKPRVDFRLRSEHDRNLEGVTGSRHDTSAEVVLSWNLFNGGSDRSRLHQYAALLNVARDARDKTCRDLRQSLSIAFNDTRKLTEQLTYLDQHQLSIEKARVAYRKQFDIGQRTLLDVLDTENELFESKRAFVNAEFDLMAAYARTHAAMGTLFSELQLSRPENMQLPDLSKVDHTQDLAENCPAEAPQLYVSDKAALNIRAQELLIESNSATVPAEPKASKKSVTSHAIEQPVSVVTSGSNVVTETEKAALANAMKAWREAWVSRNVDGYFGAYAPSYQPDSATSREAWIAQRKVKIAAAKKVTVDLADVQLDFADASHATARFQQTYSSSSYRDVVNKVLEWEKIGGRWLIVRESASGQNN
ncbi:MAG: TolC family outer membrane protein [Pseudomonadota bacterium]